MASIRLLAADYTYADLSTSISPAIERALEEGQGQGTLLVNTFCEDSFTVGILEDPEKSLHLDFCREKGIVVRRRQNPGGAVFGAKGSVMNCLYLDLSQPWVPFKSIGEAFPRFIPDMAAAVSDLFGIEARYRPVNDVEVGDRKLVATSARLENNILTLRSLVNIAPTDRATMSRALVARPEKFQDKKVKDAGSRFTCLEEEAGRPIRQQEVRALATETVNRVFEGRLELSPGGLSSLEQTYLDQYQARYTSDEWFYANSERLRFRNIPQDAKKAEAYHKAPAGLIGITLLARGNTIHDLILTADFHPSPYTVLSDMEAALMGRELSLQNLMPAIAKIYNDEKVEIPGTDLDDFAALLGKVINLV
jgi:lipoate---protein ligase